MTDTGPGTTGEPVGNAGGNGQAPPPADPHPFTGQWAYGAVEEPPKQNTTTRLTREQAARMREMEHEGVPMWMDRTGIEATVKSLSFADRTMLQGIDPRLQAEITAGFNARGISSSGNSVTFADMLRGVGNEERLSNAVCCAGFISPQLKLTKAEADQANDPDVWYVGELHITDRRKYSGFVLGMDEGEAKRISALLSDRVQGGGAG